MAETFVKYLAEAFVDETVHTDYSAKGSVCSWQQYNDNAYTLEQQK